MMETEDKFLHAAKRALDDAEKNLDASTVARLRAARRTAIEQGLRRPWYMRPVWLLPAGGLAAAAVMVTVASLLWFAEPKNHVMQANMDDLDLLAAPENPDFFAELEFYEWLEGGNDAS